MCRVSARIGRGTPLPGDAMIRWLTADVFDGLATLEDGSIDLVVTSPPFLALRSYLPADHPDKGKEIGSEATPAEFLDVLLRVTAELRRVLAPHGSICVELGDTYAGSTMSGGDDRGNERYPAGRSQSSAPVSSRSNGDGWPLAKSKTLIPELYRIALAYGFNPLTGAESPAGKWRVRNVVTWCRPNPPVGALGDKWRPATSDIVVACVSGKRFWDDLATRHPGTGLSGGSTGRRLLPGDERKFTLGPMENTGSHPSGAPLLDYWEIPLLDGEEPKPYGPQEKPKKAGTNWNSKDGPNTSRNDNGAGNFAPSEATELAGTPLLDYWEIPPTGYSGAHYAVYPPALVEPLVKAMCPERVCRTCGEPSRRITETTNALGVAVNHSEHRPDMAGRLASGEVMASKHAVEIAEKVTLGFTDCGHDDWRPGIVLDPFAGSGTTLAVASGHGHDTVGIDLDPRNEELARERVGPLMWETA